jgi:4-azaleucine resistance transporter AzlC
VIGCTLGAVFGTLVKFDTTGLDFAMTALFIVIVLDQLKTFKTKLPFIIGGGAALAALFIVGKSNMLLGGLALSVVLLIIFRKPIEKKEAEKHEHN